MSTRWLRDQEDKKTESVGSLIRTIVESPDSYFLQGCLSYKNCHI